MNLKDRLISESYGRKDRSVSLLTPAEASFQLHVQLGDLVVNAEVLKALGTNPEKK